MNKNWQFLGLLVMFMLLATGVFYLNESIYSTKLALRSRHANPVRIYIKREIKTDLYKPEKGPAPLTGWEKSGSRTQQAPADSTKAGSSGKEPDSLTSAHRDSAASR